MSALTQIKITTKTAFLVQQRARYKVLYGGRGSLKSWTIARVLLAIAQKHKVLILCAREYQRSIKDSVHRLLVSQINALGWVHDFTVNNTNIVNNHTGAEFIFAGLHYNISGLKSMEGVDICWVEEAETVSETSWRVLDPTIRKPGSEIWISFNPLHEDDPTYIRFVVKPIPGTVSQMLSWKDNPWLPRTLRLQAEYMRENDPEAYAHVWEGKTWFKNAAQVLNSKWLIKDFEVNPAWGDPRFGSDWGFSQDPTALVKNFVEVLNPEDFGKTHVVEGEEAFLPIRRNLYISEEAFGHPELDDIAALFDQVAGSRKYLIKADCSRPETISHMANKFGFLIEGHASWPGSVEDGVAHLRSYEKIIIHPNCRNMYEEARLWSFKTDPISGKILRALKPGHDHGWDATRYSLEDLVTASPSIFNSM